MALRREQSVLSDDLKPRRTPVPSSLEDVVPRPSVPDLSIIETSQANAVTHPITTEVRPHPPLSHLSYNDWRQQISCGPSHASTTSDHRHSNVAIQDILKQHALHNPTASTSGISFKEKLPFQKERVAVESQRTHVQPAGKTVSYSDFSKRPVSAPVARPYQSTVDIPNETPLSKSTPARRTFVPDGNHSLSSNPTACGKTPQSLNHRQQPNVGYNIGQHYLPASQGPHASSLVPHSAFHSQHVNFGHYQDHGSQHNGLVHGRSELSVVPNDQMHSVAHSQRPPVPQHVLPVSNGDSVHHVCQLSCCQSNLHHNINTPWSRERHSCCSSAVAITPHVPANHVHAFQHSPSSPQVSYEDLYKIVVAQNDQLKALQSQVECLLLTQKEHKAILESSHKDKERDRTPSAVSAPGHNLVSDEGTQTSDCEPIEDGCQKMSIGVMTSFIHAVTYRGRVERLDAMRNVSEHENMLSNGNHSKQSKSQSSDDCSSSSTSPKLKPPIPNKKPCKDCKTCCDDCVENVNQKERSRKWGKNKKPRQHSNESASQHRKEDNGIACPENCNCNNPGVSAAITAVRGCQAVLASRTQDFSAFNGADLPTVTEQPQSPMSSIHVDLHDYRSSSSDEESNSSQSSEETGSEEDQKHSKHSPKHNGWTFYNNVLGQVNKILEERDTGGSTAPSSEHGPQQIMTVPAPKQTDTSISKRVAFEALKGKEAPQNLKELALRYLRENHPEELASGCDSPRAKMSSGEKVQEMAVYNMPASNMSFATFRYLERYNLLPENFNPEQYLEATSNIHGYHGKHGNSHEINNGSVDRDLHGMSGKHPRISSGKLKSKPSHAPSKPLSDGHHLLQPLSKGLHKHYGAPPPVHHPSPRKHLKSNTPTSKILDITTLRQQPKLL